MNDFSVDEYEFYEKVENGDWNWITPNFIAFASPVEPAFARREKERVRAAAAAGGGAASVPPTPSGPSTSTTPGGSSAMRGRLPIPFQNCLDYFQRHNVKLVVRLNNALYDSALFEERGIEHLEMYFDDGSNPTDEIVRKFIAMSDAVIEAGGVVAVHCKAGLGRTGTLIGGVQIYFTVEDMATDDNCSILDMEVWLYGQRGNCVYAHRSTRFGRRTSTGKFSSVVTL